MDVSDHEVSSSSETPAWVGGHRARSKAKGRGKVEGTLSLGKQVIVSKITGAVIVVKKGKYLGLRHH
jgi:hypothetical protein